jgi:oligopeptide transport system permease protein
MEPDTLDIENLPDELFEAAPFSPESAEEIGYTNYSYWGSTFRTFFRSPMIKIMLAVMLFIILFTFLYPLFVALDPYSVSLQFRDWNQPPGPGHPFGTDGVGRDIWARVWYGAKMSFLLATMVSGVELAVGLILGSIWGFNKRTDPVFFAIYNTVTNIPSTIYMVLIAYIMRPNFWTIVIALLGTGWISTARWFRNRILNQREADYNMASRCLKTPMRRIITRNIIPHIMSLIIMSAALSIPAAIGSEVFLSFIGIGIPSDWITLGNLVNQSRSSFLVYPYQMLCPTILLCIITVSFYILGNRFADSSDPKNHV